MNCFFFYYYLIFNNTTEIKNVYEIKTMFFLCYSLYYEHV
jgi:hypothetical protein